MEADSLTGLIEKSLAGRVFVNVSEGDESLLGCFLPEGNIFPSMLDSKQKEVTGNNMVVRRMQPVDDQRFADSIAHLKRGKNVFWLGLPGISKSTESNFLLMEFLEHMGQEGWPKFVTHRIKEILYEYSLGPGGEVVCNSSRKAPNLEAVTSYCNEKYETLPPQQRPVLFLELGESEHDPCVQLPVFIALSSRDVMNELKSLMKAGGCFEFVVRPHSAAEMRIMGRMMLHVDKNGTLEKLDLPSNSSEEDCMSAIDSRVSIVGPIFRHVFASKSDYARHLLNMNTSAVKFFSVYNLQELGYYHIPSDLKYVVAPYPTTPQDREQRSGPCADVIFKFLSPYAAQLVSQAVHKQENIDSLRQFGFDYQVVEAVLQNSLMAESVIGPIPKWTTADWEYYKDPGYTEPLLPDHLLNNSAAILHPKCGTMSEFRGAVFHADVCGLRPRVLYKSRTHNFRLGEFFTVNDNSTAINFYACSTKSLSNHPYSVASIRAMFEALGLLKEANLDVKVNLISFVDWSLGSVCGCKFKDGNYSLTIAQLHQQASFADIGERFNSYIVRAGFYDINRFQLTRQEADKATTTKVSLK